MSVGSGGMDRYDISFFQNRKVPVRSEYVRSDAKRSGDGLHLPSLIDVRFPDHGDMVVRLQSSWTWKILHPAIHSNKSFVFLCHVYNSGNIGSRRSGDIPSVFHENLFEFVAVFYEDIFVKLLHSTSIRRNVDIFLFGCIRHSQTTPHIYEFESNPGLLSDAQGELEKQFCGSKMLLYIPFIRHYHRMKPESLYSFFFEDGIHSDQLFLA